MQTRSVIYCRVSSPRQVAEGHGLDSQEKRCKDYARNKGYKVVGVFLEKGLTGGLFDRPEMKELISFLEKNRSADPEDKIVVIFDDLKRFARDVEIHFRLKTEIYGRNGIVESPNFKFEDTPEGKFVETVMAAQSELERNQNKRQVKQKMKARLEMGYWPFCMPPGLRNFKDPTRGKILKPDGSPQAIIRKMAIEKFSRGELRTQDEVKLFVDGELKKEKIKSNLSHHGIQSLLKNPLYYGMIEYKPWKIPLAKGQHEGLVAPELYPIVLARFDNKPKIRQRKDYSDDFPLRGLVRCARCGGPFTGSWSTGRYGKKYPKYDCKKLGCSMRWKTIHKDKIHDQFQNLLYGVKPESNLVDLTIDVLNDVWGQEKALYESTRTENQSKIQEIDQEIETLKARLRKNLDDDLVETYESDLKKKLAQKRQLEGAKFDRHYSDEEFGTASRLVLGTLKDPVGMWQSPDWHNRRTIVLMYFDDRLKFDKETGFGTTLLASPIQLMQDLSRDEIPDVEMGRVSSRVVKGLLNFYKRS